MRGSESNGGDVSERDVVYGPDANQCGGDPGDDDGAADDAAGAGAVDDAVGPAATAGRAAGAGDPVDCAGSSGTSRVAPLRPVRLDGAVTLRPPTLEAVLHVCERLRASDQREVFATRFDDDPAALAADAMSVPQFSWVAFKGETPVAVIGARPMWPGVWVVFAFGTVHWDEVVLTLTKHVRRFMIPALEKMAHLAVAFCHEDHYKAQRWLARLGAEPIAPVLTEWGRERENFTLMGWRR